MEHKFYPHQSHTNLRFPTSPNFSSKIYNYNTERYRSTKNVLSQYNKRNLSLPNKFTNSKTRIKPKTFLKSQKNEIRDLFKTGFNSLNSRLQEGCLTSKFMSSNPKWKKFMFGEGIPKNKFISYKKHLQNSLKNLSRKKKSAYSMNSAKELINQMNSAKMYSSSEAKKISELTKQGAIQNDQIRSSKVGSVIKSLNNIESHLRTMKLETSNLQKLKKNHDSQRKDGFNLENLPISNRIDLDIDASESGLSKSNQEDVVLLDEVNVTELSQQAAERRPNARIGTTVTKNKLVFESPNFSYAHGGKNSRAFRRMRSNASTRQQKYPKGYKTARYPFNQPKYDPKMKLKILKKLQI